MEVAKIELNLCLFMQDGCSLLHWAVKGGSVEMVDWLIDTYGFDVNEPTEVGVCICMCNYI